MKHSRKVNLLILGMSLISGLAIFGSTAGTLAWYAFSARVYVSFTGTTVKKSVLLNIGIVDNPSESYFSDEKIAELNLERGNASEEDGNNIVWAKSTSGMDSDVINEYLSHTDYASTVLSPVTSKSRSLLETSDITLYESPDLGDLVADQNVAQHEDYVQIPFAFKILNNDSTKLHDKEIWLTDTVVQCSGQHIDEAVRVFVNNSQEKFLLNPKIKTGTTTGATVVGGLLDLNEDRTYDFIGSENHEIIYGEYSGTPTYSTNPYGVPFDEADYDNVNNTPYEEESTFYAKHDALARTVSGVTFDKVAEYETAATIKPGINETTGMFEGGKPMAYTDSTDSIGYVTLTIYIEGWDHSVVNKAANFEFNLGLKFEVNRI